MAKVIRTRTQQQHKDTLHLQHLTRTRIHIQLIPPLHQLLLPNNIQLIINRRHIPGTVIPITRLFAFWWQRVQLLMTMDRLLTYCAITTCHINRHLPRRPTLMPLGSSPLSECSESGRGFRSDLLTAWTRCAIVSIHRHTDATGQASAQQQQQAQAQIQPPQTTPTPTPTTSTTSTASTPPTTTTTASYYPYYSQPTSTTPISSSSAYPYSTSQYPPTTYSTQASNYPSQSTSTYHQPPSHGSYQTPSYTSPASASYYPGSYPTSAPSYQHSQTSQKYTIAADTTAVDMVTSNDDTAPAR